MGLSLSRYMTDGLRLRIVLEFLMKKGYNLYIRH